MENIFVTATIISVVFLVSKFIEMRFIEKESKPFKLLMRDALVVYISVVFGDFIIGQIAPMTKMSGGLGMPNVTPAFTDNPGF